MSEDSTGQGRGAKNPAGILRETYMFHYAQY